MFPGLLLASTVRTRQAHCVGSGYDSDNPAPDAHRRSGSRRRCGLLPFCASTPNKDGGAPPCDMNPSQRADSPRHYITRGRDHTASESTTVFLHASRPTPYDSGRSTTRLARESAGMWRKGRRLGPRRSASNGADGRVGWEGSARIMDAPG